MAAFSPLDGATTESKDVKQRPIKRKNKKHCKMSLKVSGRTKVHET